MARVLLVEDDPSIRVALEAALEYDGHLVVPREHGADLEVSGAHDLAAIDLAVLDVALPKGPGGIELAGTLSSNHHIPVILLTAQGDIEAKGAGYRAGADLYITKPFSVTELLWQVRALLRRTGTRHELLAAGDLTLDPLQRLARHHHDELRLTPTEFDLLATLLRHRDEVLTKPRLLELVWGHDAYDTNLVETTVRRLRTKLVDHAPQLIETVRGSGYRLRG